MVQDGGDDEEGANEVHIEMAEMKHSEMNGFREDEMAMNVVLAETEDEVGPRPLIQRLMEMGMDGAAIKKLVDEMVGSGGTMATVR